MSVEIGVMVPHPPIIMKEIGKGEEKKIRRTDLSYREAADLVAGKNPETLIIISPHALMYGDYIHVSPGERARGNMGRFNAPEVSFNVEYDDELVSYIDGIASEAAFPAGTLGDKMPELDHGTMVPLYYFLEKMPGVKIVRIGLSGLSFEEHYLMGIIIKKAVEQTGRRAAIIASGDLSHKQKEDGPYGLVPEGPEYDKRLMDVMGRGAFDELLSFDEGFCDRAAECGHRSFIIMAGAFDGTAIEPRVYSHESTFGVGYGIASFIPLGEDPDRCFLRKLRDRREEELRTVREAENPWVKLARATVERYVIERKLPDYKNIEYDGDLEYEFRGRRAGTFVSIHKNGDLRGCIGTFLPTTSCIEEEIVQNAVSACTRDPRFLPIRPDELPYLEISVDVLDTPEPVKSKEELDTKVYGVIVSKGRKRGLLLPDLPGVDTIEEQLRIACEKGGIDPEADYDIERFKVTRHADPD